MSFIVVTLLLFATETTCTTTRATSTKKSPRAISPGKQLVIIGVVVIVILLTVLIVLLIGWFVIAYTKRKRARRTATMLKITESGRELTQEKQAEMKRIKEERQREAAFLRKQTWMQHLQILEHAQKSKKPDPVVHGLLKDETNTLDYIELKRETARLIGMRPQIRLSDHVSIRSLREMRDRPDVVAYVRNIADEPLEEAEMQRENLICKVRDCRMERIGVRSDTLVMLSVDKDPKDGAGKKFKQPRQREPRPLHMNRLKDYYGNTLILCQAPMPAQFADQWQAIWEHEVGVAVWIGAFVELGRPKIDPYISLEEGAKMVCGEYTVQTLFVARFANEFDVYRVGVTFELARSDEYREIIVIHVHMWPDHRMPDEPALLADLVAQVQGHQLKQAAQGLSAMLVHCSLGVQRSPAFLAAYIGRQMWINNRRANVLGIMRYVRRNRWRAFGYGDPFAQVQIIFGVLEVIATRHEMEGIGNLNVAAEEERVFDLKARIADTKSPPADVSKIIG